MNPEMLKQMLAQLGIIRADEQDRADSITAILSAQLESVSSKTYDVKYPALKAREMIPVDMSDDPGAETVSYQQWDEFGAAQYISNYADDFPMVTALAETFSSPVKSLGAGYQFTIQDLRRAAMAGASLTERDARAARRAIEMGIELAAATGGPGFTGLANNVNVGIQAPITGAWIATPATGLQVIADIGTLIRTFNVGNVDIFPCDTLAMDSTLYNYCNTTLMSNTGDTTKTILTAIKEAFPQIRNIYAWPYLATADAAGTGPRIIAYAKDPDVLELKVPQDFEQFPPQQRNMSFSVPCHARTGGVVVRYPIAVRYMDGC